MRVHFFFIVCVARHTDWEYEVRLCTQEKLTVWRDEKHKELAALCQLFIILFVLILNGWIYVYVWIVHVKVVLFFVKFANSHIKSRTNVGILPVSSSISKETIQSVRARAHTKMIIIFRRPPSPLLPIFPLQFKHHLLRKHNFYLHFYCVAQFTSLKNNLLIWLI